MNARLLYSVKETRGGYIRQVVIWQLAEPVPGCKHLFKYRFYFGSDDGACLVRYDNERGKGDHRHIADSEFPYSFQGIKQLMIDFDQDIKQMMGANQ